MLARSEGPSGRAVPESDEVDVPDGVSWFQLGARIRGPASYCTTAMSSVIFCSLSLLSYKTNVQVPCMQRPRSVRRTPPGHALGSGYRWRTHSPQHASVWMHAAQLCVSGSYSASVLAASACATHSKPHASAKAPPHASAGTFTCRCQALSALVHARLRLSQPRISVKQTVRLLAGAKIACSPEHECQALECTCPCSPDSDAAGENQPSPSRSSSQ